MPNIQEIEDIIPQIESIGRVLAVFQSTNTTYNASSTTYSSSSQTYGGSDRISDVGPEIFDIQDILPNNLEIIDL